MVLVIKSIKTAASYSKNILKPNRAKALTDQTISHAKQPTMNNK